MAEPDIEPSLRLLTERTVREFARTKRDSAGLSNSALQALQKSASRASQVPRLLELPSAVLRHIFSELYMYDLVTICCVCRRLRQTALDDPSLWTSVQTFHLEGAAWPAMVRRSGSLPWKLSISCRGVLTPSMLERLAFLADHLHRLERLHIQAAVDPLQETSNSISHFLATLTNPAPVLKQLLIFYDDFGYEFERPTVHFPPDFLGDTSALKTFGTVNTLLDPRMSRCMAFSNLEEFIWWLPYQATLSLNRFAEVLSGLPSLQRLGISARDVESYNGQPLARKVPVAYAAWPQGQGDLLQHFLLDMLGVQDLRLWTHNMPPTVIQLENAQSLYATLRYCDIGLSDGRRVLLTLTGWMDDCFSQVSRDASLFASLRELCLDQCVWSEYAPFPPAPRLESLTLLLSAYQPLWNYFSEYFCFTLQPLLGGPWHCESLRELRFTTTRQSMPSLCTVSFGDLAHFVSKSVSFGSPRLRRLSICGVAHVCDVDLAGALDSLRELADEVQVSADSTARVEPEDIFEWQAMHRSWAQDSFTFQMGSYAFRLCV